MYPKNDHDHPAPLRYIFEGGGGGGVLYLCWERAEFLDMLPYEWIQVNRENKAVYPLLFRLKTPGKKFWLTPMDWWGVAF